MKSIGITLLISIRYGFISFYSPVCIVEGEHGKLMARMTNRNILKLMYYIVVVFMLLSSFTMLICYARIFKVLANRKKIISNRFIQNFIEKAVLKRKREAKLLNMSVITCFTQLLVSIFLIMKFAFGIDLQNVFYDQIK